MNQYTQAADAIRRPLQSEPDIREFVRYATLAANSHNTQPWKFRIAGDTVDILPDFSRRTPVVDPDDHHLYVSLGCATENLVVAANAHGRPPKVDVQRCADGSHFIGVTLGHGDPTDGRLCEAIPNRQSTKSRYDGTAVSSTDLRQLEDCAVRDGVDVLLITDRPRMDQALELIQAGNSAQMNDPTFVNELKGWIRFSEKTSIRLADGLSGPTAGSPSSPDWLGPILFSLVFREKAETHKLAQQLRSSAGLAVFLARDETPEGWINVGRSFERFALMATSMGLSHAHVNMPIEVPSVRPDFAKWLGMADRRPDLVVRFGRATPMPMSLRRPVEDVIVS